MCRTILHKKSRIVASHKNHKLDHKYQLPRPHQREIQVTPYMIMNKVAAKEKKSGIRTPLLLHSHSREDQHKPKKNHQNAKPKS